MKKKLWALAILCLSLGQVQAQEDDELARLMSEREQLILEYQYYSQQSSSFWGTQSKKDLINVIETLKKIINKDSELIGEVKEASIRKIAQSTVQSQREGKLTIEDKRNFENQISSLKSEIMVLQSAMKKRQQTAAELQNQLQSGEQLRYGKDKVITVLAVAAFILLLYAVFLQVRLNNLKASPVRRKKKV